MKSNILTFLALSIGTIFTESNIFDQDKPLHIGLSLGLGSRSHVKYLLEILEQVSQKGHRITYLSIEPFKRFGKGHNVTHYSLGGSALKVESFVDMLPFTSKDSPLRDTSKMMPLIAEFYNISFPIYEKFYKEEEPDLMICDFIANSCIDSTAKNSIPMMLGYQSLWNTISAPYLTFQGLLEPTTIENYSFWQRFKHAIIDPVKFNTIMSPMVKPLESLRKYYNIPPDSSYPRFGYMGLGLVNSFIGFENPRKIPSHMNIIGPILSDRVSELPQDLQLFLNQNSMVLYIAFGSLINIQPKLADNLLQYFQRALNYGILDGIVWGGLSSTNLDKFPKSFTFDSQEYSTESMFDGTHEKIKFLKWAPQEAILNHPNTKLFLSHGGLDSIYESLGSGTPVLVLPFIGDQPRNGMLIKENGVGDYIEWPTMDNQEIYQKFVKLLDPNNFELQSKLQHMQLITKFSSKRKAMAADLVETYAYTAKSCRMFETPKSFEVPCEMKPFLPLDYTMSSIKANLIDVYISAITMAIISIVLICFSLKTILALYRSAYKQKLD